MSSSLRTALGAVLTTVLALSVPVGSLAAPASAAPAGLTAPVALDAPDYTPAEATAIFNKLQKALSPKRLAPRKLGNPLPRKDLTLLMRDAQLAKGSMTARQASIIDSNQRPVGDGVGCQAATTGGLLGIGARTWEVVPSDHFCIHYSPGLAASAGGATLTQAQATASTMENVYAKAVGTLGFDPPLADSDGKTDVFLDQLGSDGFYGFCTTESGQRTSTAWCGLDNDFSPREFGAPAVDSLRVTAAHEFFHAIQFGYDVAEANWFMEGTAVWMEEQIYPAINDYLQYLNFSQLRNWKQSVDFQGSLHRYGAVIFWKFLSERYRDANIIRQIWNSARVSSGSRNAIQAVAAVVQARGSSLPVEFARYGVWNTLGRGTYADRSRFPVYQVNGCRNSRWCAWAGGTLAKRARDTGVLGVRLNHLSTAPLVIRAGKSLRQKSKLRVVVDGPDTSRGTQARLQVRYKGGKVRVFTIRLNSAGNGAKRVAFNPRKIRSAIVTLTNASVGFDDQLFKVRARVKY